MEWTPADPDRAVANLPLALRIAGAEPLLRRVLEAAAELTRPWVWGVGVEAGGSAVVLAADATSLVVIRGRGCERHRLADVWRVAFGIHGVTIDVHGQGIGLHPRPSVGVDELVAHLATRRT